MEVVVLAKKNPLKALLMIIAGYALLLLGAIGLVIPIWPTTPFVLLSAACFACSPKLKAKITKIPFFREHLENYKSRTGLSRKTLCISLSYLWIMLIVSALIISTSWISLLLLGVGLLVTLHILLMARSKRKARVLKPTAQEE